MASPFCTRLPSTPLHTDSTTAFKRILASQLLSSVAESILQTPKHSPVLHLPPTFPPLYASQHLLINAYNTPQLLNTLLSSTHNSKLHVLDFEDNVSHFWPPALCNRPNSLYIGHIVRCGQTLVVRKQAIQRQTLKRHHFTRPQKSSLFWRQIPSNHLPTTLTQSSVASYYQWCLQTPWQLAWFRENFPQHFGDSFDLVRRESSLLECWRPRS